MGYTVDYLDPCVGKFILIRFGEPFSYFLKMSILALGLNMNSGIRICSNFLPDLSECDLTVNGVVK